METQTNGKRFKVSFEMTTEEFSFASGLENAFKALFPTWENIEVKREDN